MTKEPGFCSQLGTLLQKNIIIRVRTKILLVTELLWPLIFFLFLLLIRHSTVVIKQPQCTYEPKALPSAGWFSLFQSYFCTLSNKCVNHSISDMDLGAPGKNLPINNFIANIRLAFYNESVLRETLSFFDDVEDVVNKFSMLDSFQGNFNGVNIADFFTKGDDMMIDLILHDKGLEYDAIESLLNSTLTRKFFTDFIEEFDKKFKILKLQRDDLPLQVISILNKMFCTEELFSNYISIRSNSNISESNLEMEKLLQNFMCKKFPIEIFYRRNVMNRTAYIEITNLILGNMTGLKINATEANSLYITTSQFFEKMKSSELANNALALWKHFLLHSATNSSLAKNSTLKNLDLASHMFCGGTLSGMDNIFKIQKKLEQLREQMIRTDPRYIDTMRQSGVQLGDDPNIVLPWNLYNQTVICDQFEHEIIEDKCWLWLQQYNLPHDFTMQLFTLFRGYILVAPSSPIVNRVMSDMSDQLVLIDYFCQSFLHWYDNMEKYAEVFKESKFFKVVGNFARFFITFHETANIFQNYTYGEAILKLFYKLSENNWQNETITYMREHLSHLHNMIKCFRQDRFVLMKSENEVERAASCLTKTYQYFLGIVFDELDNNSTALPKFTKYKIRMASYLVDSTSQIMDSLWNPRPRDRPFIDLKYLYFGFSFVQDIVDRIIISFHTNKTAPRVGMYAQQFPSNCDLIDLFIKSIERSFPMFMTLSWMFSVAITLKNMVEEKQYRLKEFMKIMGLKTSAYWLSCQANLAAAVGALIYFALFLPYPSVLPYLKNMTFLQQCSLCLIAQVAFGWGCSFIALYEEGMQGLQWSTLFLPLTADHRLSFGFVLIMLIFDGILYLIFTWYIENVFPGAYGIPKPWLFFFQQKYWSRQKSTFPVACDGISSETVTVIHESSCNPVGVAVRHLTKVYDNKKALSNLSVNFYDSEITSVLGPNGAGKTTMMSIICGLFPSTSGSVIIYGKDILSSISEIRQSLGFCPQHNILFDNLTVEEHLWFYAKLKGMPTAELNEEIENFLLNTKLRYKRKEISKNLSGGMKRKLSISIAFIAGSKTVVLDEPTTGVDPYSRRSIWDMLLKFKKGRTIILSTHYFDEAEILGDRIAIISEGSLKCSGSAMFLKTYYGSGYYLTLIKNSLGKLHLEKAQPEELIKFVSNYIPNAKLVRCSAQEVKFMLPSVNLLELKSLVTALDSELKNIGCSSYGLSESSLEEIFRHEITESVKTNNTHKKQKLTMPSFKYLRERIRSMLSSISKSTTTYNAQSKYFKAGNTEKIAVYIDECNDSFDRRQRQQLKSDVKRTSKSEIACHENDMIKNSSPALLVRRHFSENYPITFYESIWRCILLQAAALFRKRALNFFRDWRTILSVILLPIFLITLALYLMSLRFSSSYFDKEYQPLILDSDLYGTSNYLFFAYFHSNFVSFYFFELYLFSDSKQQFLYPYITQMERHGPGNICMNRFSLENSISQCSPDISESDISWNISKLSYENSSKCFCGKDNTYICSENAYSFQPPVLKSPFGSIVNMSTLNITEWLTMTEKTYRKKRYGGFSTGLPSVITVENSYTDLNETVQLLKERILKFFQSTNINMTILQNSGIHIPTFDTGVFINLMEDMIPQYNVKVWFNNQGWAAFPAYFSAFSNAYLRGNLPSDSDSDEYGIAVTNHPIKGYQKSSLTQEKKNSVAAELAMCVAILLAFCSVTAGFCLPVVEDQNSDSKHLQFISGMRPWVYWFVNFAFDMSVYIFTVTLTVIILIAFNEEPYVATSYAILFMFTIFIAFGLGMLPIVYLLSQLFKSPSLAFVTVLIIGFFIGSITNVLTTAFEILGVEDENLHNLSMHMKNAFVIFPQYNLARALSDIKITYHFYSSANRILDRHYFADLISWQVSGKALFITVVEGFVSFMVLMITEHCCYLFKNQQVYLHLLICLECKKELQFSESNKVSSLEDDDGNVTAEQRHALKGACADNAIKVVNLSKVYHTCSSIARKSQVVVNDLNFEVLQGECFGLLGHNGAGKTTTFKMITGKCSISQGCVYFAKTHAPRSNWKSITDIGYCPQFDALDERLTGREILQFYADIRSMCRKCKDAAVLHYIWRLGLNSHADRLIRTYSGGLKRRLSTAISLIGNPRIILLDEPTASMDPESRRLIWDVILERINLGQSVLLTSNSMEECEILCNRVGIMSNGSFKCLDAIQELKEKYGKGYVIAISLKAGNEWQMDSMIQELKDRLKLASDHTKVSDIISCISALKEIFCIDGCALNQTSLDDVFVSLVEHVLHLQLSFVDGLYSSKLCTVFYLHGVCQTVENVVVEKLLNSFSSQSVYEPKALSSAGIFSMFQSYFCTLPNKCLNYTTDDWDLGPVSRKLPINDFISGFRKSMKKQIAFNKTIEILDYSKLLIDQFWSFSEYQNDFESVELMKLYNLTGASGALRLLAITLGIENVNVSRHFFEDLLKSYSETFAVDKQEVVETFNKKSFKLLCEESKAERYFLVNSNKTSTTPRDVHKALCLLSGFADTKSTPNLDMFLIDHILNNLTGYEIGFQKFLYLANVLESYVQITKKFSFIPAGVDLVEQFLNYNAPTNLKNDSVMKRLDFLSHIFCGAELTGLDEILKSQKKLEQLREDMVRTDPRNIDARREQLFSRKNENGLPWNLKNSTVCSRYKHSDIGTREDKCWLWLQSYSLPHEFAAQLYTLFRGYIFVSPRSPVVEKIVEKMKSRLDVVAAFKDILLSTFENLEIYRTKFESSKLSKASKNFARLMKNINSIVNLFENDTRQDEKLKLIDFFSNELWRNASLENFNSSFLQTYNILKCFLCDRFVIVDSEKDLEQDGSCLTKTFHFFAGIVFPQLNSSSLTLPKYTKYKIRMSHYLVDKTAQISDKIWNPRPRDRPFLDLRYLYFGFSFMQDYIDSIILSMHVNKSAARFGIYAQQFPSNCHRIDTFIKAIERSMPMFMTLSWMFSVALILKNIVHEKQFRLKEFMKIMGLYNSAHWLAWFLQSFIMLLISSLMIVLVVSYGNVLKYTDMGCLLVFFVAYAFAIIPQCFLMSTMFNQANVAAGLGTLLYFALFLPYPAMLPYAEYMTNTHLFFSCLIPQIAFGWGCSILASFEEAKIGLKWSTFTHSLSAMSYLNFFAMISMLLFDGALFFVLTWYIENVYPGTHGIPKPWHFFLMPSYWTGCKTDKENKSKVVYSALESKTQENCNLEVGVSVRNLTKIYGSGNKSKCSLNNLSVDFYANQITAVLGPNGAGKTTMMSIMCGLFPPTSGNVLVYNQDIMSNLAEVRRSVGFCPQHNVLFDTLTVEEHLQFYASLKRLTGTEQKLQIQDLLKQTKLMNKRNAYSKHLSGGMKRKLSIAIAFLGSSKTVILDEPTAGVDPYSRRSIWDLLLKCKKDRTIILSTHFFDEAELLGDRIAIICAGKLKCCGSPVFLKQLYKSGCNLNLALSQADLKNNGNTTATLVDFVCGFVPDAKLVKCSPQEIQFTFPTVDLLELKSLITELDAKLANLKCSSYGLAEGGIEKIFLQEVALSKEDEQLPSQQQGFSAQKSLSGKEEKLASKLSSDKTPEKKQSPHAVNGLNLEKENFFEDRFYHSSLPDSKKSAVTSEQCKTYFESIWLQVDGFLKKRMLNLVRDWRACVAVQHCYVFKIILPVFLVALALYLLSLRFSEVLFNLDYRPITVDETVYGRNTYMFYSSVGNEHNSVNKYFQTIIEDIMKHGMGNRRKKQQRWLSNVKQNRTFSEPVTEMKKENLTKCFCDEDNTYFCPKNAYPFKPPERITSFGENLVDMTNLSIANWILMTEKKYRMKRYGGISLVTLPHEVTEISATKTGKDWDRLYTHLMEFFESMGFNNTSLPVDGTPIPEWNMTRLETVLNQVTPKYNIKIWFNNQGWVALPVYTNIFFNAHLRAALPEAENPDDYGIEVINHPIRNPLEVSVSDGSSVAAEMALSVSILIAFCSVTAGTCLFTVEDRSSECKHLQFVSGMRRWLYWIINFIFDLIIFMVAVGLLLVILHFFNETPYIGSAHAILATLAHLMAFGIGIIPIVYCISQLFKSSTLAYVSVMVAGFFIGSITNVLTTSFEILGAEDEYLNYLSRMLKAYFVIFPQYNLARGFTDIKIMYHFYVSSGKPMGYEYYVDLLEWDILGKFIFAFISEGVLAFFILLILEYHYELIEFWKSICINISIHKDCDESLEEVYSGNASSVALKVTDLTKIYGNWFQNTNKQFTAVNKLCFEVHRGECFGLLGHNGAGKTTTFKMITRRCSVTSGSVLFPAKKRDSMKYQSEIGYCPQFDALDPRLTARETLLFYAKIKGIQKEFQNPVVNYFIHRLKIEAYADRLVGKYSGGIKRRLSTAIALIGNPYIILLDEPTAGMDAESRRFLWDVILERVHCGHSVLFTSNSMEECEVLCNRVGIMAHGKFKCLDTIHGLKEKYGHTYVLTIKLEAGSDMNTLKEEIEKMLPNSKVLEEHINLLKFQIPATKDTVSRIIKCVAYLKGKFNIEGHSLMQTSLDDVFVALAEEHVHFD
ncbi:Retinal-specific ATP-binding cassette transporter [Trichinella sp. T8]|nr:Retinal-specific ATP-binding cassette transporter [Trichinella sp. T8]